MTATKEVARTTISAAAARLATVVALSGDDAGSHGLVLVEDEHVVATDGKRLVVIAEPHADGLFSADERVALVPQHALKDAVRDADRVSVERHRCTTLDEHGKSLRFVPFREDSDEPEQDYMDWRKLVPKPGRVVTRLDPVLLCDVFKTMASAGCRVVTMHAGKPDEAVVFRGDVGEQEVTFVVMPITT